MKRKIISIILFILGLGLCSYPLVSNILQQMKNQRIIGTYQNEIEDSDAEMIKDCLEEATEYNEALQKLNGGILDSNIEEMLSYEYYSKLLNLPGNGIMGSIRIPRIDVNIPIYHGTEEDVLSVGVGHVYGSSLPVGSSNAHSLLTGHSGMPNAKLFTRLDEMEEGDYFYITICDTVLTYEVSEIQIIKPEEIDSLDIESGKDLVSLITCTPYGLNTHRLVVTGERTDYTESLLSNVDSLYQTMSLRELIFTILPFVFLILAITNGIIHRKGRKQSEKKK